jgi:hypothetical protein
MESASSHRRRVWQNITCIGRMAVIVIPLEDHTLSAFNAGCEAQLHQVSNCGTKPTAHMIGLQPYSSLPDNHCGFAEAHDLRPLYSAGYHLEKTNSERHEPQCDW